MGLVGLNAFVPPPTIVFENAPSGLCFSGPSIKPTSRPPALSDPEGTLVKSLIMETCQVLAAGLAVALFANWLSPRGLPLNRDYFKDARRSTENPSTAVLERLSTQAGDTKRLPEITGEEALRLFQDPRRGQGRVLFVDARKEAVFLLGHIPEAYPLDRFYPDPDLPAIVLAGSGAEQVVVYCAGGTCEDSHYAALLLIEAGMDPTRIQVYAGGFTEWTSHSWPVERGTRASGLITSQFP
jgi:rhodanese-related sulfurtransferase